jgi:hypothetical protein
MTAGAPKNRGKSELVEADQTTQNDFHHRRSGRRLGMLV